MRTYSVEVTRKQWVTIDIKADSEEEAEGKALSMAEEEAESIFNKAEVSESLDVYVEGSFEE